MTMVFPYEQFDVSGVRTYRLAARPSKARASEFGRACAPGTTIGGFIDSLPDCLGAADFRAVVQAIVTARRTDGGVLWGLGAHVVKTGLAPVLINLMERGFVSAIAVNGATVIHDFEVAISGATSEDVDEALARGTFGMAEETGLFLNDAIRRGADSGLGLGQAVCRDLEERQPPHADLSILAAAGRLGIPITVHVAIGTDIIHMHPAASGSAIGESSLRDFRCFVSNVSRLERGVYINCGSAVVLPEVFLKAVALSRNRGVKFEGLSTVNLDFVRRYRPDTNVVLRPTSGTGRGYSLIGHHEIMIPLLAAAVIEAEARACD